MMNNQYSNDDPTPGPKNIPPPSDDIPDAGSVALEDENSLYPKDDLPMDEEDDYSDEADADDLAEVDDDNGLEGFDIDNKLQDPPNEA